MGASKTERNIEAVDLRFVRSEIAARQLAYKDLAVYLGISPQDLSRKVNGKVPFNAFEIVTLSDAIGCTTDRLLGRE